MNNVIFEGIATALVTPLTDSGVDFDSMGRLIDWQIEEGIDALVICGTTGEGSTLSDEEHKACIGDDHTDDDANQILDGDADEDQLVNNEENQDGHNRKGDGAHRSNAIVQQPFPNGRKAG